MTYNVFSWTLNPTQSVNSSSVIYFYQFEALQILRIYLHWKLGRTEIHWDRPVCPCVVNAHQEWLFVALCVAVIIV